MSFSLSRTDRSTSPSRAKIRKAVMESLETRRLFSSYAIAELTLGGDYSEVHQLNEAGQVAGYAYNADNTSAHAYLFTDHNDNGQIDAGEMNELGTLGGTASEGTLLNEAGQVAGYSYIGGNAAIHAFLYTDTNNNGQTDPGELLDLGTLGGSAAFARFLNEAGQVAGDSKIGGDVDDHAFLFTDANGNGVVDSGEMADLGTLGGTYSVAIGLNNAGQVAGNSTTAGGDTHAFLYTDTNGNAVVDAGEVIDLGTLGGSSSFATGINAAGQVIGYSYTAGDAEIHAFVYTGGQMLDLGTFGGTLSEATLINDAGQVAGYSTDADGNSHAYIFTDANANGQVDAGEVADLGTFGGISSAVTAMNQAGQVTGYFETAEGAQRAFLYTDANGNGLVDAGEAVDLGTLGGSYSLPSDLTEDGRVIGYSSNADDTALFAYIYTDANNNGVVDAGEMQNLNLLIPGDAGWVLEQPTMINEAGDIVGVGYLNGVLSPFVISEQDAPTEEPATIQDVEALVTELVSEGRLRSVSGAVLLTTLRIARNQLEAGRENVARLVLHATELTINALHNSRRLSDEDYELLIGMLNEVLENLA